MDNLRWGTPTEKLLSERAIFRSEEYISLLTLEEEVWKDGAPYGYEGYRASTLGRIYSEKIGRIVEGWSHNGKGYVKFVMMLDGQHVDIPIHVMICTIFHGNKPHPDHTVDDLHSQIESNKVTRINRIKTDNMPSNLRWASKSEQMFNRNNNPRDYLIAQIKDNQIIDFYDKQNILEIFDVDDITIPDKGVYYNGYLWLYENFTSLDMVGEIWKPININDVIYQVSNMGRVETRRKTAKNGSVIGDPKRRTFGSTTITGYKQVGLMGRSFHVHRLVMTAFNGYIEDGLIINHIDSDRSNNKLENLEITTYSGNSIHAVLSGSRSVTPVRQISLEGKIIAEYPSVQSAADATGIHPKSISNCANGYQGTSGKFRWEHI